MMNGSMAAVQPNGYSGLAEQKGTVSQLWTYHPTSSTDLPPETLTLKITTVATAEADSASDPGYSSYRDISKQKVTASAMGHDAVPHYTDIYSIGTAEAGGVRLKTFPVDSNGRVLVSFPLSARAELTGFRSYGFYYSTPLKGYAKAAVNYSAARDDRDVRLSRPYADHDDETYDQNSNTTTGNTTFSYDVKQHPSVTEHVPNLQTFSSAVTGTWPTTANGLYNLTYTWNPADSTNDTWTMHEQIMPYGDRFVDLNGRWAGSASPSQSITITYTAKSGVDNATATARYILNLHDEWDNWREDSAHPIDRQTRLLPSPPTRADWVGGPDADQTATWSQGRDVGFEISVGVSGQFTLGDFAQFGIDVTGTHTETITSEMGLETTAPAGKMVFRAIDQSWLRRHYLVDHYMPPGRDKNAARTDGAWEQEWDDLSTLSNRRTFSPLYNFGDYNLDGQVNNLDDGVN